MSKKKIVNVAKYAEVSGHATTSTLASHVKFCPKPWSCGRCDEKDGYWKGFRERIFGVCIGLAIVCIVTVVVGAIYGAGETKGQADYAVVTNQLNIATNNLNSVLENNLSLTKSNESLYRSALEINRIATEAQAGWQACEVGKQHVGWSFLPTNSIQFKSIVATNWTKAY